MKTKDTLFEQALAINDNRIPQGGLRHVEENIYTYTCQTASEVHSFPQGYSVLSARELIEIRTNRILEELPEKSGISFLPTKTRTLSNILNNPNNRLKLLPHI